ncbi:hypothetical protein ACFU53_08720 [Streptomyces sp. NPDC057474]|uniref:hypothetical protein n=1 Tax=Streptomyces sp. NPDC057474 TaxID=3346144 RepID=UPI00369FF20D
MTVTTASGGSAPACAIGYRVTGERSGGFQGEIVIPAAGSAALGFKATRGSANPAPTTFTLNGVVCTSTWRELSRADRAPSRP